MRRNWVLWMVLGLCLAGCSSDTKAPAFQARFVAGGLDNGLGDFLDEHAGEPVRLDLQWAPGAWQGGTAEESQFFVLFESCAEKLEKGEKPEVGNCTGTEYSVPKQEGQPALVEANGGWRLRGVFEAAERTGPLRGLYAVTLEPVEL